MIAAVEDVLSEAVVRRIVTVVRPDLSISTVMRKNGHGYIRSRIRELNRTAGTIPVVIVIDLDSPVACIPNVLRDWMPFPRASNLFFRIAVMEIESWVMGDRDAFAEFLSIPLDRIPTNPDAILQPKEHVVSLARRSRRKDIRADLVPLGGDTRIVGPAYNPRLTAFVADTWSPIAAAKTSPSLRRALDRLRIAF
jgi:hypothetical protein